MRTSYIYPSTAHFDLLFDNNDFVSRAGALHEIQVYKPPYYNRGAGLFSVLSNIVRGSIPFLKSIILPEFGSFTKNVTSDVSNGIPLKESVKDNMGKSIRNIGRRVVNRGGGKRKKKNKTRALPRRKKMRRRKCLSMKNDVFSRAEYNI